MHIFDIFNFFIRTSCRARNQWERRGLPWLRRSDGLDYLRPERPGPAARSGLDVEDVE